MKIFSWKGFRNLFNQNCQTKEFVIRTAFNQYCAGNNGFENATMSEMNRRYELFRAGYLVANLITERQKF